FVPARVGLFGVDRCKRAERPGSVWGSPHQSFPPAGVVPAGAAVFPPGPLRGAADPAPADPLGPVSHGRSVGRARGPVRTGRGRVSEQESRRLLSAVPRRDVVARHLVTIAGSNRLARRRALEVPESPSLASA